MDLGDISLHNKHGPSERLLLWSEGCRTDIFTIMSLGNMHLGFLFSSINDDGRTWPVGSCWLREEDTYVSSPCLTVVVGMVLGKHLMNHHLDKIGSEEMGLKVFHWLNRRMHPNTEYCNIHGNKAMENKEDSVRQSVAEKDTEALLLRDVLLNGILAIGTLGHHVDSLCPEACIEEDDFLIMDEEVVEEEKDEEEPSNDKVKEDAALATTLSEPVVPVVEPAKMHSSSMKEDNFTCFITEEILMHEVEDGGAANIQEQPLLMVEKVEKVRTTLADLFAAEAFSPSAPGEKNCQDIVIVAGASTSKPTLCTEKMHQKKPTKPTPKPLKATRKLSRVMRKMLGKKIHPEQLNGHSNAEGPLTA